MLETVIECCRLDERGATGVDRSDLLHDGLHLVRHLQVLQVIGNLAVFGLFLIRIVCFGTFGFGLVWCTASSGNCFRCMNEN